MLHEAVNREDFVHFRGKWIRDHTASKDIPKDELFLSCAFAKRPSLTFGCSYLVPLQSLSKLHAASVLCCAMQACMPLASVWVCR